MRIRVRTAVLVVALGAATALFIATPGAIATQDQAVVAGQVNTATSATVVHNTSSFNGQPVPCTVLNTYTGLRACGGDTGVEAHGGLVAVLGNGSGTGVHGLGKTYGVEGSTSTGSGVFGQNSGSTGIGVEGETGGTGSGVYGHATKNGVGVYGESEAGTGTYGVGAIRGVQGTTSTGSGVYGENTGSVGIGVEGKTGGTGSAMYGNATANGVGVFGKSQSGTALRADSPSGTALQVNGKTKFSRSGTTTISAGTASKTISLGGVTTSSMVIATAQQSLSVYVKAAVPASGSFKLVLTGNAPSGGLKVAYFVLN
jgi:hypothetical protein